MNGATTTMSTTASHHHHHPQSSASSSLEESVVGSSSLSSTTNTAAGAPTNHHKNHNNELDHIDDSSSSSSSNSTNTNNTINRPVVTLERRKSSLQQAASVTTDATRRMVCGGLAGMIAKTATNPLERIKMLSQTGEHSGASSGGGQKKASIFNIYRDIIRNEGFFRGLWAGNGVNLIRIFPAKAVVFASNDMYKSTLRKWSGTPSNQPLSGSLSFLAGGLAGMTASACTYPLDFARGRISGKLGLAGVKGGKQYNGIISTIVLTVKDEGVLALYKGITPTLMGAMPYEGIKFGTVGVLEKAFPPRTTDDCDSDSSKPASPLRKMLFGGIGGVMAGLITYPNDTVRRMLQLQGSRGTTHHYLGYWDCVRQVYRQDGIARFYRGCFINIVRMAPNTAVQFGSYELLKQYTANWHL